MPRYLFFLLVLMTCGTHAETVSGILMGHHEIVVKAKSQGEIAEVKYKEGDWVESGAVIAVIDDQQEKIERNLAQVESESAEQDFKTTEKLQKFVSKEEVTKKKNEFLRKRSGFELKEYMLSNTRVAAPISGVITEMTHERGETVSSGQDFLKLVQLDKLIFDIYVTPKDLAHFSPGQKMSFRTDLHKEQKFSATVSHVSPVVDSASGTVKVRLALENLKEASGQYLLKPGTLAFVEY